VTATANQARWKTFAPKRRVLAVAHNVTAATRLFDVVHLIAEDPRLEVIFTDPGSSAFPAGTDDFLRARGVRRLPWREAVEESGGRCDGPESREPLIHSLSTPRPSCG
jgi:hypothetical protein